MTKPKQGDVWRYDYLWRWQQEDGETEGRKTRPTAFVATVSDAEGQTNLFILAITSKQPAQDRNALEIPQIERVRAGLEKDKRLWVMLDEYNHDILEKSYYLDPQARIGAFSSAFHKKALAAFIEMAKQGEAKRISRRDD